MSRYLEDLEDVAADMASALKALRGYFMQIAEMHDKLDSSALSDLLRRYDALHEDDQ